MPVFAATTAQAALTRQLSHHKPERRQALAKIGRDLGGKRLHGRHVHNLAMAAASKRGRAGRRQSTMVESSFSSQPNPINLKTTAKLQERHMLRHPLHPYAILMP